MTRRCRFGASSSESDRVKSIVALRLTGDGVSMLSKKKMCLNSTQGTVRAQVCANVFLLRSIKLVGWARCVNTAIYYSARVPESGVRESDEA